MILTVVSVNAQTPSPDAARYGPYPAYYKEYVITDVA